MEHVEVILAFVLFIGFLIFGLYFFNPLKSDRVLDSSLFYAFDEIVENTSSSILTYGVSLNQTVAPQNISFALSRSDIPGNGFFIETSAGQQLQGNYNGGVISVNRNGSDFFYVRFGSFAAHTTPINGAIPLVYGVNYTLSSSDRAKLISEEKMRSLNTSYYTYYDGVRTSFNLPRRVDFGVELAFANSTIELTRIIPEGFEVVSKSERVEVLLIGGDTEFANLLVGVW